ncbi:GAF domain-containing protein [Sporobolomyces koalae]|uniref:GAF domain-containing protein n=1 Tax=Sporobolomyces koalae TaxID=500713 RepID=UPI00317697C5
MLRTDSPKDDLAAQAAHQRLADSDAHRTGSIRTSIESRPSTAASTVPTSHYADSPSSPFPAQRYDKTTSTFPTPVSYPRQNGARPASVRHNNLDSSLGQNSARGAKSPFRKALLAFGIGDKYKGVERGNGSDLAKVEEKPRMGAVETAREQGRRVLRYVKRKLNSKTPKEELPKTWEEYGKAYAAREIDVDDPPLPPVREHDDASDPTPFEQRAYMAPRPENEVARQNVVNRLDLFGTRAKANAGTAAVSTSNADHPDGSVPEDQRTVSVRRGSTAGSLTSNPASVLDDGIEAPDADSLENHPIFRSIVSRCREVFNTQVGLITILDDDQQLFLAAGGMPEGVDKLPRDVTFCSHAILGEEKGMVVLDTQKDWRFANNLPSTALGARFYAGVPLFARSAGQDSAPSVPIGTICVADVTPRSEFSEAHRRVLRDFASQASNAIEQWVSQRMAIKLARLHGSLPNASLPDLPKITSNEVPLLTPPSSAGLTSAANSSSVSLPAPARPKTAPAAPVPSLPASPPASVHQFNALHSRHTSTASTSSVGASSVTSSAAYPPQYLQRPSTALAFAVTTEDPVSLVPRDLQKMFDTATKMLAKALELDLVYLAALDLHVSPEPTLRILSARGLPSPAPSFDPNLHLKALRAPEGGLIYKNPRYVPNGPGSYSSGILIPILEVRRVGYVLCGYTQHAQRDFVQRDLSYMVKFAEQLETGVARLGRTDPQLSPLMARSPSAASAASSGTTIGKAKESATSFRHSCEGMAAYTTRPVSPTSVVGSTGSRPVTEEADSLQLPFDFGRTPSLRFDDDIGTSAVGPSGRAPLERRDSRSSFVSSTSSAAAAPPVPPRAYQIPPGLADSPAPSALDVQAIPRHLIRQARDPKILHEPLIPPEIQHLLLTTPPPPRKVHSTPITSITSLSYPPTTSSEWPADDGKPNLLKRIRALALRNGRSGVDDQAITLPPTSPMLRHEVLDLKRPTRSGYAPHSARTWRDYRSLYASGQIDIETPPLPPVDSPADDYPAGRSAVKSDLPLATLTPFDLAHFPAPLSQSRLSPIRERVISSLDLLGAFLPSDDTLVDLQWTPSTSSPALSPTSPPIGSPSSSSTQSWRQDSLFHPSSRSRPRGTSTTSTAPSTAYSAKSSHFGSSPSFAFVRSIQSHPPLAQILDRISLEAGFTGAENGRGPSAATITLFPTSPATTYLDVLGATGDARDWKRIGLEGALDAHTILNGSRGLVVYDVEKDWRWKGNRDLEEKNVRFYAAMPIFAPSSLSLRTTDVAFSVAQFEEEADGARMAIGVISLMNDQAQDPGSFGPSARAGLRSLASEITVEIERFVLQRAAASEALASRRTSATSAATFQSGSVPAPSLRNARKDVFGRSQGPNAKRGHKKKVSFDACASSNNQMDIHSGAVPVAPMPRHPSSTLDEHDAVPSLFSTHSPQALLDLACASLARSLNLALVYLVELSRLPPQSTSTALSFVSNSPSLTLVSSHGLPSNSNEEHANFDPILHLQALRAPEGGLLYRAASSNEPFDSGMLLPVLEVAETRKGWVIAGYVEQPGRRWGQHEMSIFEQTTRGIEKILLWREEWI